MAFHRAGRPGAVRRDDRDLQQIFQYLDGKLARSDQESLEWQRSGGNWWYEDALRLPPVPQATAAMSDIEAIDAVFGEHRSNLMRIERRARQPATTRWELNADPIQRSIGLGLLVSVLALLGLLFVKLRS